MQKLIFQMEFVRLALVRGSCNNLINVKKSYFGLAGLFYFLYLFPLLIAPPTAVAEAPPEAILVGGLILGGFVLCATIVLAP